MTLQEGSQKLGYTEYGPRALTIDMDGALRAKIAHCKFKDAIERNELFSAMNQAAQAVSVALNTTYTGLCISNPLGSGIRAYIRSVQIALSVAPAAIAPIGLIGGYSASVDVTHTTPLTPASNRLGSGGGPICKADSAATIPTPTWKHPIVSGFTAGALPSMSPALLDLDGLFALDPGGFICIGALTAVTGLFGMSWEEVPL